MNILALDLSLTCTGWAATSDGATESGRQSFPTRKGKHQALRFSEFRDWLTKTIQLQQPDLVIYELPPQLLSRDAINALIGLVTRVEEHCAIRGIRCESVHSQKLKKHATGKGNATKEQMKQAATEKYPWYCAATDKTADEADALHALDFAKTNFGEAK